MVYKTSYSGNRADDFRKCFDIESEWCWKYADLMLRGMESRNLADTKQHHIVPVSYYKSTGLKCFHNHPSVTTGNITELSAVEHLYAHYLLTKCSIGGMQRLTRDAFRVLINTGGGVPDELVSLIDLEDVNESYGSTKTFNINCRINEKYRDIVAFLKLKEGGITGAVERMLADVDKSMTPEDVAILESVRRMKKF